ncbi:hypothetical protein EDC96DRAFT_549836 [Choanephora cucurbitarum]|nr:hypothetical protein EDC96DRAFT_549836 [Choanephora cucurbitarum]
MLYDSLFLLHVDTSSSTSSIDVVSFAYHLNASFKYLSISHISVSICAILRVRDQVISQKYFALAIVLLPDPFTSLILDNTASEVFRIQLYGYHWEIDTRVGWIDPRYYAGRLQASVGITCLRRILGQPMPPWYLFPNGSHLMLSGKLLLIGS